MGWNFNYIATIPYSLVFKHGEEAAPRYTCYGFSEFVIAYHPLNIEVFYADSLVFTNKYS